MNLLAQALLLTSAVNLVQGKVCQFEYNFIRGGNSGKCFHIVDIEKNLEDAWKHCKSKKGKLFEPQTKQEAIEVWKYFDGSPLVDPFTRFWTGYAWIWSQISDTEIALDYGAWLSLSDQTPMPENLWGPSDPNDNTNDPRCTMAENNGLIDSHCGTKYFAVCESPMLKEL